MWFDLFFIYLFNNFFFFLYLLRQSRDSSRGSINVGWFIVIILKSFHTHSDRARKKWFRRKRRAWCAALTPPRLYAAAGTVVNRAKADRRDTTTMNPPRQSHNGSGKSNFDQAINFTVYDMHRVLYQFHATPRLCRLKTATRARATARWMFHSFFFLFLFCFVLNLFIYFPYNNIRFTAFPPVSGQRRDKIGSSRARAALR